MTSPRLLRALLASGALVLAIAGTALESHRRAYVEESRLVWHSLGIAERHPDATRQIEREPDPLFQRLRMGRVILADALHARWLRELPPNEIEEAARDLHLHLARAEAWAIEALRARPLSWEAALVLGGSRFLTTWRDAEQALYEEPDAWRKPLEAARGLAPSEPEPTRLLAATSLLVWPGLDATGRGNAESLIREAFRDPPTLRLLLADWRAAAPDTPTFEGLLPDRRSTWSMLMEIYAQEGRWAEYCRVRPSWWRSLLEEGRERLAEAEEQRDRGDPRRSRATLLGLLDVLPPDQRTIPLAETIMDWLPSGPVGPRTLPRMEAWLRWGLPLALRDLPSLSPRTFGRLASLGGGRLPPELETWAWLESGDLQLALEAEARSDRQWSEDWGPYFLAKAAHFAGRGQEDAAGEALDRVHDAWTNGWVFQSLAHEIGRRNRPPETATRWEGTAWRWRGPVAFLEISLQTPVAGLQIAMDDIASSGGALLGNVDGREIACVPIRHDDPVRLETRLGAGAHLVRVEPAVTGRLVPGDVVVVPSR